MNRSIINKVFPASYPWRIFARFVLLQNVFIIATFIAATLAGRYLTQRNTTLSIYSELTTTLKLLSERAYENELARCSFSSHENLADVWVFRGNGDYLCTNSRSQARPSSEIELFATEAIQNNTQTAILNEQTHQWLGSAVRAGNYVLLGTFPKSEVSLRTQVFMDSFVYYLLWVAALLSLSSIWIGHELVFPIGRLMDKTKRILNTTPDAVTDAEASSDSFGEWTDIEHAINEIRDDLEAKRRRLERERLELATVIGSIGDAILAINPKGTPLFFNSRFALLFAGNSAHPNWTLWDLVRDPEILDAFSSSLSTAKQSATRTISIDFESEGLRFFTLSVSALSRSDGSVYGAVGIFHDITELKLAEQMRIDFVANVSHELRTPLTSIKGYSDTLLADLSSGRPVKRQFIDIIAKNSDRLMNLITDLLDLSSIESQTQSLQRAPLSTEEATERAIGQLGARFESKSQVLTTSFEATHVYADAARLEQVLVNLLDNASKYTPVAGTISVEWRSVHEHCVLTVSDSGPGISLEHQKRLFERFYRVDKARSRELGGTGLGLAIVKHIMQHHGGQVWVESSLGGGAKFSCQFPKHKH